VCVCLCNRNGNGIGFVLDSTIVGFHAAAAARWIDLIG